MDRWDLVIQILIPGVAVIAFLLVVCNEVAVADRVLAVREHRKAEEAKRKAQNEPARPVEAPEPQQEDNAEPVATLEVA